MKQSYPEISIYQCLARMALFTALAELSTRQIAETDDATGMAENKVAATKGGAIAKQARRSLEANTGKSVVTGENFLPPGKAKRPKKVK
jgi:DNA-damage-inducible protein D